MCKVIQFKIEVAVPLPSFSNEKGSEMRGDE